jgi:transcription-repair coupling factor
MEQLYQKFIGFEKTKEFFETVRHKKSLIRDCDVIISVANIAGAKSLLCLTAYRTFKKSVVYLAADAESKNRISAELHSFLPEENIIVFKDHDSIEAELYRLLNTRGLFIIVLEPQDLNICLPELDQWQKSRFELSKEMNLPIENLLAWLNQAGYQRLDLVSEIGEYAVRGSIVDVYPPKNENPLRIEFLDNQIVSLRFFDTITQRSINLLSKITIFALRKKESGKNLLPSALPQDSLTFAETDSDLPNQIRFGENDGEFNFNFVAPPVYLGNFNLLKREIESSQNEYFIICLQEHQYQRLTHIFGNKPTYLLGTMLEGFFAPAENLCLITEKELYGAPIVRAPRRHFKGQPLDDLLALNKGDYVVHVDYGIGQFQDVIRLKLNPAPIDINSKFKIQNSKFSDSCGVEKDFLLIRYANEQKLYVPVENIGLVERYIGEQDQPPSLSIIGSRRWLLTKIKVAQATEQYAKELLNIYAQRSIARKKPYDKDTDWQEEFEATFPYEETQDQLKALADVKRDLESAKPMDRLISGDTGFGKTEIALRAAFKTVTGLKQVAVLVPTTILCYQHYHTFKKRFAIFPVRIEMLSRFTKTSERQQIIAALKSGKVDIVIGTHTLLSPHIEFKDLGLLVIDEEHKFGVKQKERIKKLRANLDVLTLTATPIPRTLYRALVGLADISSIHTPPSGRQDIETKVIYWDDEIIFQKINYEIKRGGQVLFIHNRIQTIKNIAKRLQNLNLDWRIALAHSQLAEKFLAEIYLDFLDKKFDILVSTAIIESGVDMPNVNTIIVNRADQFGLSDLHQLRGRVGRSDKKAYAIFVLPDEKEFAQNRDENTEPRQLYKKRLSTLLAYSQLGAGFRLAMRDMELRGIGNILGTEQHGNVALVGLNLYQQMLRNAIGQLRGEALKTEPVLSLDVEAYIPEDYVRDSYERVAIYKRLLSLEHERELESIAEELKDRFGKYPVVIRNLLAIAAIRIKARDLNLLKVSLKNKQITIVNLKKTTTFIGDIQSLQNILTRQLTT